MAIPMGVDEDALLAPAFPMRAVDAPGNRFPFCIVWSPLPVITWFLPFIGHMGIATSEGIIYDFAGPYTIGREHFAFGRPTRYLQCTITSAEEAAKWDQSIQRGCAIYATRMHNLFCDNCHSHVATCLEHMQYQGRKRWNMVGLCVWMLVCGRFCGPAGLLRTWLPFLGLVLLLALARTLA